MNQVVAIFDPSCKLLDLSETERALYDKNIPVIKTSEDNELSKTVASGSYDGCVYVVSSETVALKYQCDFIKNTKSIEKWLIVIVGRFAAPPEVIKSEWQLNLRKADSFVSIITSSPENAANEIMTAFPVFKEADASGVLISSRKKLVGCRTLTGMLKYVSPELNYEICSEEEFAKKSIYVSSIIIMGAAPEDFMLPVPQDSFTRVTLLYNKVDKSPFDYVRREETIRRTVRVMNSLGWNIAETFPRFFITSLLYENFKKNLSSGFATFGELRLDNRFLMWDEFGLPLRREDYTDEAINSFIQQFDVLGKLVR